MTTDDQSTTEATPDREEPTGETSDTESSSADESLTRALAAIAAQIREVRGQLDRLLTIQFDRVKLKLRTGMSRMVAGVLLLAVGVTAVVVAVIYLVAGAAGAFSELFDGNAWAGEIAAGVLVLSTIALSAGIVQWRLRRGELKRLMRKYETREEGR